MCRPCTISRSVALYSARGDQGGDGTAGVDAASVLDEAADRAPTAATPLAPLPAVIGGKYHPTRLIAKGG